MIFGLVVTGLEMVVIGLVLITLISVEVLLGFRVLKLGRKRIVYHRWVGIAILVVGVVHGILGLVFGLGLRIG